MGAPEGSAEFIFDDMGRRYALCITRGLGASFKSAGSGADGHWQKVPAFQLKDFNYFRNRLQRANIADLRQLLLRGGFSCLALNNAQIHARITKLLNSGELAFFERKSGADGASGSGAVAKSKPRREPLQTLPYIHVCPVDLIVNLPPSPPPSAKPAPGVSPQAQAQVLREAARQGMPFCELCTQV